MDFSHRISHSEESQHSVEEDHDNALGAGVEEC